VQNCQSARDKLKINQLKIDKNQIKKLGGQYIFSASEILNANELGLRFLKAVGEESEFWKIYIYKLS
jgi:hypothetical protein